jgi:hypothetical protein
MNLMPEKFASVLVTRVYPMRRCEQDDHDRGGDCRIRLHGNETSQETRVSNS